MDTSPLSRGFRTNRVRDGRNSMCSYFRSSNRAEAAFTMATDADGCSICSIAVSWGSPALLGYLYSPHCPRNFVYFCCHRCCRWLVFSGFALLPAQTGYPRHGYLRFRAATLDWNNCLWWLFQLPSVVSKKTRSGKYTKCPKSWRQWARTARECHST